MLSTNTDGDLTKYEECLKHMQKKSIPQFLKNNGLQHLVTNPELAASVCRYLLYVVSCHSDLVVVNAAANTLLYHVEGGVCFAPDRSQILAIAMNMGLNKAALSEDFSGDELPKQDYANGTSLSRSPEPFHFRQVVRCISELLRWNGPYWTDAARDMLFDLLVAMLIDSRMRETMMDHHATLCLGHLFNTYSEAAWSEKKMLDLVERLRDVRPQAPALALAGLPRLGRGHRLRQAAAYLYLQALVDVDVIDLPAAVAVEDVLSVVRRLSDRALSAKVETEPAWLYMVLTCADAAVGSERLEPDQEQVLQEMVRFLQLRVSEVKVYPDDAGPLAKMEVKEMMTTLVAKWSQMTENCSP